MYLYFDNNGILKEIVDDVATRKGNNEVNKIYIYVDGITPKTEWITYQTSDGVQSNETLIETTITKTIPYDRNRDLKYFKNFQEYLFYVATIPSSVSAVSGLTKASVRVALIDDSLMTLGLIIFTIEDSVVLQDSFITESQYQYLLNIISNFEELNNTGVIGISTQIVNGALAPYDQGRIVLSTYNDAFTIATVVKNSTGQNVYNVLDMTFVKQVPYNNSNPNLEGLEINGKRYKVAYNTSQLTNDAGFITNAVSNLMNYYTKTTIDEKFANIDFSDYYTKTESDGRYVLTTNFSWNNLANKPTSLSDFINDEGFITNTVSNLTNYYDKTTVDNIVATLKKGAFQVVSELPSTGAEGIVYLVGTEAPYTMYIWENNAFLNIGTTEVNLDGYVKGTNLNANYVVLGNGGSNVVASVYTINNQNANDPNSLLTANVINTLLGTKQDVLTQGQGIKISDDVISTPVSTTSATISQESVNKLKYDGKPILVDYAINDDSGRNIVDTYATFDDVHALDIGDITSSSNIYQTLYQNVYENDTAKKNVVIFSTEGFVDSATSLIGSGDHIATPYQDNKILIDSVFVLNSDNSATTIISSDTVVIDIGTISMSGGTLSPAILSEINTAISENKTIVIKGSIGGTTIISSNVMWGGGQLIALSITISDGINLIVLMLSLQDGVYMVAMGGLQEKLVSGTNIKTINGQSIVGNGNLEISGSNFQIIDLTSDSRLNSIGKLYSAIINSQSLNFSNQSSIFNNIATAVNNGLIPILKFTDGYGYYKEYFSSFPSGSTVFVFTMNHITQPTLSYLFNNVITLRVDNTQNSASYGDLSQLPNTVVISSGAFGNSGSLFGNESTDLTQALSKARRNLSAGIFILNNVEDKIYYVSNNPKDTSTSLIAYTITQENMEILNLTLSGDIFNYTKTTYPLGGESSASKMIDLGTITNINTNTPAFTLSSDEKTSIDEAYNNNKIVYVKFNYVNENNNNETVILPIESKVNQVGGSYIYYGSGTLQNHEVWSFSISSTSVFVNNITNTHRTKLFDLGTLSQTTGTLNNATEIANAFNSGYTPIIKFTYNNITYYFTEPSGKYNSSSNTGSLSWISILSDKTVEKFTLNYPGENYILSNEELGGGGETLFEVIDLTSETTYKSISAIYNYMKNTIIMSDSPITFDTSYYSAINTALSGGKIPILKFTDGYGYYQNNGNGGAFAFNLYFNESMEKMGHTMHLLINAVSDEGKNAFCGLKDIKQIPYTWVKENGFSGESGTFTSTEVQSLLAVFTQAVLEGTVINAIQDLQNGMLYMVDYFAQSDTTATLTGHVFLQISSDFSAISNLTITIDLNTFTGTRTIENFSFNINFIYLGNLMLNGGTLEESKIQQIIRTFTLQTIVFQLYFGIDNVGYKASIAHYDNASTYTFYAFDANTNLIAYKLSVNSTTKQYTLTKITTAESPKAYRVNIEFTNFIEGGTTTLSDTYKNILESARVNGASVVYDSVLNTYYRLLYTETSTNLTLLYSTLDNELGIIEVNTATGVATIKKVFKSGKNSTINLDTIINNKTNYDNVFNYLVDQGFARAYFNVEGFLDQENGIGNEQYYEAYLSGENKYFSSCGKIYQYIVDTSEQGFHVELVGNSLFEEKNRKRINIYMAGGNSEIAKRNPDDSSLTSFSVIFGANFTKGHKKARLESYRINELARLDNNIFTFDANGKYLISDLLKKIFAYHYENTVIEPTITAVVIQGTNDGWPETWLKGMFPTAYSFYYSLSYENIGANILYRHIGSLGKAIGHQIDYPSDKFTEYRILHFRIGFVIDYQKIDENQSSYWKGTMQETYLEVYAKVFTNSADVFIRSRKF